MTSLHWMINITLPTIIPFSLITPILIVYYIKHRKTLKAKLKNIPNRISDEPINVENDKKNYKLKLLVCHFILLILTVEWLTNIVDGLAYLPNFKKFIAQDLTLPPINYTNVQLTPNCWIDQNIKLRQFSSLEDWITIILPFSIHGSLVLLTMPIVTLLLRILSKAFFNYSYKGIMNKCLVLLFLRSLVLFILLSIRRTHYPASILQLACVLTDYICFLIASRRFYVVLKSRKIEARWHSTRRDYTEKYYVFYQYAVTSTYTAITFSVFTVSTFVNSGLAVFDFFIHTNVCVISYMTYGYFNIKLDESTRNFLGLEYHNIDYVRFILGDTYQFLIFFAYLMVVLGILITIIRRRKFYQRVNHAITRPLIEQYHKSIYEPNSMNNANV